MPIDKIYIFGLYSQDGKDNKNSLFKVSAEKTIGISDDSFAFIKAMRSFNYDKNKKTMSDSMLRELYYDKYFLYGLFNLRIGRNVKTFDFTRTYSVLNFLSRSSYMGDMNDRVLNKKPLDGMSFIMNDITNKEINQYIAIHTYVDNASDKDTINNQKYLFEMTQSQDKLMQSIFIFNDNQDYPSVALAKSQTIVDVIKYNTTARYDFTKGGAFSSVSGIEYNANDKLLLGLESITLGRKGEHNGVKKHLELKGADDSVSYYKDLMSKNYLSLYSQYKWVDASFMFNWLENLSDSSRMFSTWVNYKLETVEVNLRANNFQGGDNTEFGVVGEKKAYEFGFFVSYLWVD